MNATIYRCGWCGHPTDKNGEPLQGHAIIKAARIIDTYGDYRTEKVNGACCPYRYFGSEEAYYEAIRDDESER